MGGGSSLPNGAPFDIFNLKVGEKGADVLPLPARLSTVARHRVEDAVNKNNPRAFTLAMQGMTHTINGSVFEMDSVARNEIVQLGDLEIWEFANLEVGGGGMGMGMMNIKCRIRCIFTEYNFRYSDGNLHRVTSRCIRN